MHIGSTSGTWPGLGNWNFLLMRSLTTEEHAHFKDFGYVIVKGVLEDADFEGEKGPLCRTNLSLFIFKAFAFNFFSSSRRRVCARCCRLLRFNEVATSNFTRLSEQHAIWNVLNSLNLFSKRV